MSIQLTLPLVHERQLQVQRRQPPCSGARRRRRSALQRRQHVGGKRRGGNRRAGRQQAYGGSGCGRIARLGGRNETAQCLLCIAGRLLAPVNGT